jgi:hypothetical protein
MGLLDQKNHVKPIGRIFAKLAEDFRRNSFSSPQRETAMVIPDTGLSPDQSSTDWTYGKAFMNLIGKGKKPCIVLESRARDEGYLRSRGVTELISLSDAGRA